MLINRFNVYQSKTEREFFYNLNLEFNSIYNNPNKFLITFVSNVNNDVFK